MYYLYINTIGQRELFVMVVVVVVGMFCNTTNKTTHIHIEMVLHTLCGVSGAEHQLCQTPSILYKSPSTAMPSRHKINDFRRFSVDFPVLFGVHFFDFPQNWDTLYV